MNETLCALALTHLEGLSQANALRAFKHYGSASAVLADASPAEPKLAAALKHAPAALDWAKREIEACERRGVRTICLGDPAYPARLAECPDAPLVVFYRGTSDLNAQHIVAVVGTRRITEYGRDLCRRFCDDLARLVPDAVVVSGLAYGVDINTHRGCLKSGLQTIGVVAHGLDTIYPSLHRDTAREMLGCGGILTEFPFRTNADKGNFVRRNRIIAGLADATIVVESAQKGGALITARLAQDYNRSVFAFPGRTGDEFSAGCNRLIRDNVAGLIASAEDFAQAMMWAQSKGDAAAVQRELFPELTGEQRTVVDALKDVENKTISELAADLQLPFHRVSALLVEMELLGIVRGLPGGIYRLLK